MTAEALPIGQADGNVARRRGIPPMIAILSLATGEPGPQLPDLGEVPPHPEARQLMEQLGGLLTAFGYQVYPAADEALNTAEAIERLIATYVASAHREGALLILLVAGPSVMRGGDSDAVGQHLYQLGRDGRPPPTSVNEWVHRIQNDSPRLPGALVLADLTGSGQLLSEQSQRFTDRATQVPRKHWILAASGSDGIAVDLRLVRAVVQVLRDNRVRYRAVDPSQPFIPTATIWREILVELRRRAVDPLQEPDCTSIGENSSPTFFWLPDGLDRVAGRWPGFTPGPSGGGGSVDALKADEPGILLNPRGDANARTPQPIQKQVDSIAGASGSPVFGRRSELDRLVRWANGQSPDSVVVIGKPGAGKSALIGTLVRAIAPVGSPWRDESREWSRAAPDAPRGLAAAQFAFVNARGINWSQIAGEVADQWQLTRPPGDAEWTTDEVIAALRRRPEAPLLVLDGLDESHGVADVVASFVLPLIGQVRDDGTNLVKAVIGTRSEGTDVAPLLDGVGDRPDVLVDLDLITTEDLAAALVRFVSAELEEVGRYRPAPARALAEAMARRLTGAGASGPEPGVTYPLPWGEFLAARIGLQTVLREPPVDDVREAAHRGAQVPVDLRELLWSDLLDTGSPWSVAVADALAWVEEPGVPEVLIPIFAEAFAADRPTTAEVAAALKELAPRYLREAMDDDGRTLFRLSSETLAQRLRRDPLPGPGMAEGE